MCDSSPGARNTLVLGVRCLEWDDKMWPCKPATTRVVFRTVQNSTFIIPLRCRYLSHRVCTCDILGSLTASPSNFAELHGRRGEYPSPVPSRIRLQN